MIGSRITRREMLKLSAVGGIGLALGLGGCTTYPKDVNWTEVSDNDFSIEKFHEWYTSYKLYKGINPNLNLRQSGYSPTFELSIRSGFSPGMDYSSSKMYAVAPGSLRDFGAIDVAKTGRLGGNYVVLEHRNLDKNLPTTSTFTSHYAHLGKIHVEYGHPINRGDLIADVEYYSHAKLMFQHGFNWVDPDNYGLGHSYMRFWDGRTDINITDMSLRDSKQIDVCNKLLVYARSDIMSRLNQIEHRPYKEGKFCRWDTIDIFRYLNELYQAKPKLFTDLSQDDFAKIKEEFYRNQPIILTLPLKP